jgi:threonine/homoserine/homoserine lactone efflux protein
MKEVLMSAVLLGFSAGFAPGPLMSLVISQSLQHGAREGAKTALVPLVTDIPVIILSLLLTTQLSQMKPFLGLISFAGCAFVLYLAWGNFRAPHVTVNGAPTEARSWQKGIITNFLSPNPWLFWFTVGAATLIKANAVGWLAAVLFLVVFYVLLCGTKTLLAVVAGRLRAFLEGRAYRLVLRLLGVSLVLLALLLLRDGLRYMGL